MEVGGEGDFIYLSLHYHHQNDSCIKMGRVPGISVFGVSSSDLCSLFYFQKMLSASEESQAESS